MFIKFRPIVFFTLVTILMSISFTNAQLWIRCPLMYVSDQEEIVYEKDKEKKIVPTQKKIKGNSGRQKGEFTVLHSVCKGEDLFLEVTPEIFEVEDGVDFFNPNISDLPSFISVVIYSKGSHDPRKIEKIRETVLRKVNGFHVFNRGVWQFVNNEYCEMSKSLSCDPLMKSNLSEGNLGGSDILNLCPERALGGKGLLIIVNVIKEENHEKEYSLKTPWESRCESNNYQKIIFEYNDTNFSDRLEELGSTESDLRNALHDKWEKYDLILQASEVSFSRFLIKPKKEFLKFAMYYDLYIPDITQDNSFKNKERELLDKKLGDFKRSTLSCEKLQEIIERNISLSPIPPKRRRYTINGTEKKRGAKKVLETKGTKGARDSRWLAYLLFFKMPWNRNPKHCFIIVSK